MTEASRLALAEWFDNIDWDMMHTEAYRVRAFADLMQVSALRAEPLSVSSEPVAWRWRNMLGSQDNWTYGRDEPTHHPQYINEPLYAEENSNGDHDIDNSLLHNRNAAISVALGPGHAGTNKDMPPEGYSAADAQRSLAYREALEAVLAYEQERAKLNGLTDCTCMGHSRESENAYEMDQCPHQRARALTTSAGADAAETKEDVQREIDYFEEHSDRFAVAHKSIVGAVLADAAGVRERPSVNEYANSYEYRGDQDYVPTEGERAMIEDAIEGYLSIASVVPSEALQCREALEALSMWVTAERQKYRVAGGMPAGGFDNMTPIEIALAKIEGEIDRRAALLQPPKSGGTDG